MQSFPSAYIEQVTNIKVDGNQQLLLAGYTDSDDVPGHELSPVPFHDGGGGDIFLTKLVDDGGGQLSPLFFRYLGGSGLDYEWDLKVDQAGNLWMVGHTGSADFPVTPDAFTFQPTLTSPQTNDSAGPFDAFIAVLDPVGTVLHATFLGGTGDDRALALALDSKGHAHIFGFTSSTDLHIKDPLRGEHDESLGFDKAQGEGDFFLADFTIDGGLDFLSYIGGSGSEGFFDPTGPDVAVDSLGATYFVGSSASDDFPHTDHAFQRRNNAPPGVPNMVVVKVVPTPDPSTLAALEPNLGSSIGLSVVAHGTHMSAQCELDFGGGPSTIFSANTSRLDVNVAPHICGAVDVTLICPGSPISVLPQGFTFTGCDGSVDAGSSDGGPLPAPTLGCGCGSTSAPLAASWILGASLLAMARRGRRRRNP